MSSAWNQLSGNWMWEERNYSEVSRTRYPELFISSMKQVAEEAGLTAEGSLRIQGETESSVLVLHGRLRFGLDMDDIRVDVCIKKGEELLFDGIFSIDNLSTDEGDEALERIPVHIRQNRNSAEEQTKKNACDLIRKALVSSVKTLREEILTKASSH